LVIGGKEVQPSIIVPVSRFPIKTEEFIKKKSIDYRPPGGWRFYVMVLKKLYDLPRTYISL
jgi:hypothetical protein